MTTGGSWTLFKLVSQRFVVVLYQQVALLILLLLLLLLLGIVDCFNMRAREGMQQH